MRRVVSLFLAFFLVIAVMAKSVTPAASLPSYYANIDGKSGSTLFNAVHTVAKEGYSSLGYDGLYNAYKYTDLRDNGKVWDMYSDCSWNLNSDRCGSYSSECDCFNREHSIPKSWFGGSTSGPGCDIFHLIPTDGKVNGIRSNYVYGEVSNASYNYQGSKKGSAKSISIVNGNTIAGKEGSTISFSGTVFEPRDEYKGDIARGYMGALLRWATEKAFTSSEGSKFFTTNFSVGSFGLTKYGVALLMKWHRQDPVSQKEVDRNNGIQQTQGNRNPFIDYPYLAEYIWGEKAGESVDLDDMITSSDDRFVLGESDGSLEGGGNIDPDVEYTITWLVNGESFTAGNPTTVVQEGKVITILPAAPASCDEVSNQFVGWSEEEIIGTTDDVPADLFSTADDAPDIVQNTTFHAVFAQVEESEIYAEQSAPITMSLEDTNGWTLSGLDRQTKYWKMIKGSYIESPELNYSTISTITINMRTWGGSSYNTIEVKAGEQVIGKLVAKNNNLNNYTIEPTATSGTGVLYFSSPTCTDSNGPALSSITIETMGGGTTTVYDYSRYLTSCHGTSTEIVTSTHAPLLGKKILRDGQLMIEYNGVYYNILGQPINNL